MEEPFNVIFDGKSAPPKSAVICLCDVTDPDFQTLLNSPKYLKSICTRHSGFYYTCVFERIRNLLKKKMLEWKASGKMSSLTGATKGLDQAITKEIKEKNYDESSGFVDQGGDHNDNEQQKESQQQHNYDLGTTSSSDDTNEHDEDENMDMDRDHDYSDIEKDTKSKEEAVNFFFKKIICVYHYHYHDLVY